MMFLPRPKKKTSAIDWQQVLDCAQIGVVALTAYLYFFYIPSGWEVEGPQMVVKLMRLQLLRDATLAAGFFILAVTVSARSMRAFFGGMAVFFLLDSVSALDYIFASRPSQPGANWSDIVWCAPFLFVVFFAATWNREEEPIPEAASSPSRVIIVSQILPILIPLLVLFMGRLSSGLAHDFNNLLCVISGHAEILSERLAPSDRAINSITQIKKASDSAAALTRQLLAFSRKQVFHPRTLDLNTIVAETEKLVARLIGEHIEISTPMHPMLGHVRVDPVQIEQVLINLVLNARDAMPQGGKLILETSNVDLEQNSPSRREIVPAGKYVVVAVTDTGCGMDEETLSRIFEPFYTTKELGKGSGLGLATVYGIVKQSGGFIWVYSEPGQGATFKVYFPRVENPLTTASADKPSLEIRQGTETVLLVENAEPLRALAKDFLKSSGYAVLEAENGKEALRIASAYGGPIQLLLTDVIMPGMGGKQLAQQLTSLRPATKVLYMSGYPNDGIVQSGILATGLVFLEKPFTREILLRKVRQVLDDLPQPG
jgi:signal transduction histidine kinase/ActR/RegA family two-component response regulator